MPKPSLQDKTELPAGRGLGGIVFRELRQHPICLGALGFLVLLHVLAVFAPLIANDRPYLLDAIDHAAYDSARRSLVGVASSLKELADEGPELYAVSHADRPDAPAYSEAVRLEASALGQRLDTLKASVAEEQRGPLDALQEEADELVLQLASTSDRALSDRALAVEAAERLLVRAKAVRRDFVVKEEGSPGGIELLPRRSYPLFASLSGREVFAMAVSLLLLLWPLWTALVNRILRPVDVKLRGLIQFASILSFALLAALLWPQSNAAASAFDVSGSKAGLTEGRIVATKVVFAPVAIGFAETHVEESFRPPTWTAASEIDDRGAYVRGARVPRVDPVSGFAPLTTPVDVRFGEAGRNSPWRHPIGTDEIGRDLLVRMLYGARISLAVGLVSTLLLAMIGIAIGALAGYVGGRTDLLLSRLIEVVQCVPAFFLILTAVAIVPARSLHPIFAIVLFIGLVRWTGIARLMRAECLRLRTQDFVLAARTSGASSARIIFRHVIPNAMGPILVAITFSAAAGILTESAISFLGFGVREPIPSWGSLLAESRSAEHWWIQVFPGLAIFATVLAYNLVGEALRDAMDPRRSAPVGLVQSNSSGTSK